MSTPCAERILLYGRLSAPTRPLLQTLKHPAYTLCYWRCDVRLETPFLVRSALLPALLVFQLIFGAIGCDSATPSGVPKSAQLVGLRLDPPDIQLQIARSAQLTLTGIYADDSSKVLTSDVVWSTNNSAVATVSPTGSVYAIRGGRAQISATEQTTGLSVSSAVTVQSTAAPSAELTGLSIVPATLTCNTGESQSLLVRGTYSNNSTSFIHEGLVSLSNAPAVATVTLSSLQVTPASVTLTAGQSQQMSVTGSYSDSTTQALTSEAVWRSSNPTVATVSQTGLVIGRVAGDATISATVTGIVSTAPLSVSAGTPQGNYPEGSFETPLDLGTFTAPHIEVSNGHTVDTTQSFYSFGLPQGAFYSVIIGGANDDVDLYVVGNDAGFSSLECQGNRPGLETEYCVLMQSSGDRVYFLVNGSHTSAGAEYTIAVEVIETVAVNSLPYNGALVDSNGSSRVYAISTSDAVVDVSLTDLTGDFGLFVQQNTIDCISSVTGVNPESCPNMVVNNQTVYVGVDSYLAEEGATAVLKVQAATLESEAVDLGAAPTFHFGEANADDNLGFSDYLLAVEPGKSYNFYLSDMTVDADIWAIYDFEGNPLTCTGNVKVEGLQPEYCTLQSGTNTQVIIRTWVWSSAGAYLLSAMETPAQ